MFSQEPEDHCAAVSLTCFLVSKAREGKDPAGQTSLHLGDGVRPWLFTVLKQNAASAYKTYTNTGGDSESVGTSSVNMLPLKALTQSGTGKMFLWSWS